MMGGMGDDDEPSRARRRHRRALTVMFLLLAATVATAIWFDWYLAWFLAIACSVVIAGLLDPG